jgi:hypothetical protein
MAQLQTSDNHRYPHITVPALMVPADTGDVAWTHDKKEAVAAAVAGPPRAASVSTTAALRPTRRGEGRQAGGE